MKKVFALLLSVAMVICMMPSMAFAATVTTVEVSPATAEVAKGGTQTFTATVKDEDGNAMDGETVSWEVSGGVAGTSITDGKLTVAAGETATSLTVTAKSVTDDTKSGTATVTVTEATSNPVVTTVEVTPETADVEQGGTQEFSATVKDADGKAMNDEEVTWEVTGGSSSDTKIATNGTLTVGSDETVDTQITVTATSKTKSSVTDTATVTVTAKTVSTKGTLTADNFTITVPKDVTYDGTAKEVTVVKKAEVTGTVGDITVNYADSKGTALKGAPTDAGTYTVTFDVAASDDYNEAKGLAAGTLVINKKALTIDGATATARKYDGTTAVAISGVTFGSDSLTISTDYTATGVLEDANVADGKEVTVTVTLKNNNYTLAQNTFKTTVNISKADAPTLPDTNVTAKAGEAKTLTVDLTGIPSDAGVESYTVEAATDNDSILDGTATCADGVLTIKLANTGEKDQTATIPVTVASKNYANITANVIVTLTDKEVPEVTCKDITKVYDGEAVDVSAAEPKATVGDAEIEGTWAFKNNAEPKTVANSGTYTVVFTPEDEETYASVEKNITVTIEKADLTVTPTFTEITAAEATLADAALDATAVYKDTDKAVAGTIAWDDGDSTAVEQGKSYGWTFTPSTGAENYNVAKGTLIPWKASTPTPGGGGGAIVTDPLPATKTESTNAVQNYVKPADYEEAEAAEIKAIMDKAAEDIKNAKTAEEVKAIEAAAKEAIDKIDTAEEKAVIRTVEATKFRATSKRTTLNGKKAIKITWNKPDGVDFDGYDIYRSTKKNSGFGKKPFFTTTKQTYTNNKGLEVGKTYYYKVRGFKYVNGRKVYTEYSYKAIRTMK